MAVLRQTSGVPPEDIRMNVSPFGPTLFGRLRYPDTGGYYRLHPSDDTRFPCRCGTSCAIDCDGSCGCFACRVADVDLKSAEALKMLREEP
jgi:hypothetical protein